MRKALSHLAAVGLLSLAVALPYYTLSNSYFCKSDDFIEAHRAAFEDSRHPGGVFSTSHFHTEKYRPLNRWLNLETYRLGDGSPHWFRLRNAAFHILNVCLVYFLGVALFHSLPMAAAGALLFGLHPLANQGVAGAVMTNTTAATLALAALLIFIKSGILQSETKPSRLLVAVALTAFGALFYEPDVAVLGIMILSLALVPHLGWRKAAGRTCWLALLTSSATVVGLMMLSRAALGITRKPIIPSLPTLLKNACMYVAAVSLPIDPLLAHKWLGTPMPQDVGFKHLAVLLPVILVLATAGVFARHWLLAGIRRMDRQVTGFLIISALVSISPLLLFNAHPSETYLYLPLSFVVLLFVYASGSLLGERRTAWRVLMAGVSLVAVLGTMNRIQQVTACGETARNILSEFAEYRPESNSRYVLLAKYPGEPASNGYGMYGHTGLDAIGSGEQGLIAIPKAFQLVVGDDHLAVTMPSSDAFRAECATTRAQDPRTDCFWIHVDGRLEQLPR